MSDAYIQVTVSMPGKEPVGYKFHVKHVYGTMTRATDPEKKFLDVFYGGLRRVFGGSAHFDGFVRQESVEPVKRRPGRPRKVVDDVPSGG